MLITEHLTRYLSHLKHLSLHFAVIEHEVSQLNIKGHGAMLEMSHRSFLSIYDSCLRETYGED